MLVTPFQELSIRCVDAAHEYARIHSIETMGTVDGPGTRYVIFMQGCHFRCKYCHNRDTWDLNGGGLYSVTELLAEILSYLPFIDASGGGVTVSGGEPMLQREFVSVLFKMLHFQGIHTCLDTNGYVPPVDYGRELDKFVRGTDLFLLDLKHIDEQKHIDLTAISNEHVLRFARYLSDMQRPVWIRHVVVPGYTDEPDDLRRLAEFIASLNNVERVELLPYHNLGTHKWQALGERYPLAGVEPPGMEQMERVKSIFSEFALPLAVTG